MLPKKENAGNESHLINFNIKWVLKDEYMCATERIQKKLCVYESSPYSDGAGGGNKEWDDDFPDLYVEVSPMKCPHCNEVPCTWLEHREALDQLVENHLP